MAILATSQFAYAVPLRRGADGYWRGRAHTRRDRESLVGDSPEVVVANGVVRLGRQDGGTRTVAFGVGPALEVALRDGDVLEADYGAMGELSVRLLRENALLFSAGAISLTLTAHGIAIEIDPRAEDMEYKYTALALDDPERWLVWLDPASPEYERQLAALEDVPSRVKHVSFAVRCDDWNTSCEVNRRVVDERRPWGYDFMDVSTRIASREHFIDYLRALPESRPDDLFVRFTINGESREVKEGDTAVVEGWRVHVQRVVSPNNGFSRTELAVARTATGIDNAALREAVRKLTETFPYISR